MEYQKMKEICFYSKIDDEIKDEIYSALDRYFSLGDYELKKIQPENCSKCAEKNKCKVVVFALDIKMLQEDTFVNELTNRGSAVIPMVVFKSLSPSTRFRIWEPYCVLNLKEVRENLKNHEIGDSHHLTYPWDVPHIKIPSWWIWDVLIVDDEIEIKDKVSIPSFYKLLIKLLFKWHFLPESKGGINVYVSNFERIENDKRIYKIKIDKDNITGEEIPFCLETLLNMDIIFVDLLQEKKFKGLRWIREFEHIKKISGFPLVIVLSRLSRYQGQLIPASEEADYFLSKQDILSARGCSLIEILWFHLQRRNELLLDILPKDVSVEGIGGVLKEDEVEVRKDILRLLYYSRYPNVKEIQVIKSPSTGKSGAKVYFVNVRVGGHLTPTRVVKIDRLDNISYERYNFNKYISPHIEAFTSVPSFVVKMIRNSEILGGCEYPGVGVWKDYNGKWMVDFEEFLLEYPDREKIKEKTHELFDLVLAPLHRAEINLDQIKNEYGEYSETRLRNLLNFFEGVLRFENRSVELSDNSSGLPVQVYHVEAGENNKLKMKLIYRENNGMVKFFVSEVDPFLFLRRGKILRINKSSNNEESYKIERLNVSLNTNLKELQRPPKLSLIHGDLHPRNILYSHTTNYLWLIDFFTSGPGPLAFDFAVFEVNIRWFVISEIMKELTNKPRFLDFLREIEEYIADFRNPEHLSFINNLQPTYKESLISSIIAIQTAEEYAFTNYFRTEVERREYWTTVGLFALCNWRRAMKGESLCVEKLLMMTLIDFIRERHNIRIINEQ